MMKQLSTRFGTFIWTLTTPLSLLAAGTSGGSQYSPTFSPGDLIAWWICNGRKRNPIGGWLLYFYWQLYAGLLMSAVFFASNIQSYIPENFESATTYWLFLLSAVPSPLCANMTETS